jgi:hypothetical protein
LCEHRPVKRLSLAFAAGCGALLALASSAAAATCEIRRGEEFQSCLTIRHQVEPDGQVRLLRSTATLVMQLDACPARVARRKVTLRGPDGERLARVSASGTCRRDGDGALARWRAVSRRSALVDPGTTLHTDWAGVDEERDGDGFAEVEVGDGDGE